MWEEILYVILIIYLIINGIYIEHSMKEEVFT